MTPSTRHGVLQALLEESTDSHIPGAKDKATGCITDVVGEDPLPRCSSSEEETITPDMTTCSLDLHNDDPSYSANTPFPQCSLSNNIRLEPNQFPHPLILRLRRASRGRRVLFTHIQNPDMS